MASDVEIVNNALLLLGDQQITALTDASNSARLAAGLLNQTKDAVLRAHPWNCAMTRQALAELSDDPAFGWTHQFQLPTDPYCLRALAINDDEEDGNTGDTFKVEGRRLLTNAGTANLRYIRRITDPNDFDGLLYEATSARLAAKMAYAITGDANKSSLMWQLYERLIRSARTVDGQEGSPDVINVTTLTEVR